MIKVFIRERRMERHMTQKQLAEKLKNSAGKPLSQSDLSRYEKGKPLPPLDILYQIAVVLKYKLDDLVPVELDEPKK
jgi:transcriptional regulator with XRE-family HTH domain